MNINPKIKKWFCDNFHKLLITILWFKLIIGITIYEFFSNEIFMAFAAFTSIPTTIFWFLVQKWKKALENHE